MQYKKYFLLILDIFIFYLILDRLSLYIGQVEEPFLKEAVVVFLTVFSMEMLGLYDWKGLPKNEFLYFVTVVIVFVTVASLIFNYAIYFHAIGRKVYLSYYIFLVVYLFVRNILFLKYPLSSEVYAIGSIEAFDGFDIKFKLFDKSVKLRSRDILVVDASNIHPKYLNDIVRFKLRGGEVCTFMEFYEKRFLKVPLELYDNILALVTLDGFDKIKRKEQIFLKRLMDIAFSLVLLLILFPILLIVAILVKITSEGPVFYQQIRTGEHGVPFAILKFRTMVKDAEKLGVKWAEKDDPRITKIGRFLRKTRLDELPQLINILRGDMSFIGPRPERPEFDETLSTSIPYWRLRYLVKPGLTGWAQVNFDYGASIEDSQEKLKYDLYYIKNFSFYLDLKIVFKTLQVVVFGKGR